MTMIMLNKTVEYQHGVPTNDCGCQSTGHRYDMWMVLTAV